MPVYNPPLRDMQFVMHEVLKVSDAFQQMPRHADVDQATLNAVLEEAGKFAAEVAQPLNRIGDEQARTLVRPRLRRPGLALCAEQFSLRDAQLGQPGLDHVPGLVAWRL